MVVLGLPLVLPIAVLSFFLGFIPYIGSFLATGLAFLVTVAVGSTTDIAIMAIWTIVFNIVQGNFVAPLVYGRAVSLHPAVVLLAIPAGNAIAGDHGHVPRGAVPGRGRSQLAHGAARVRRERPAGRSPMARRSSEPRSRTRWKVRPARDRRYEPA